MNSLNQSSGVVNSASSRTAIDTLAWLIDGAFASDPSHSLLANIRDLPDEDWTALPPSGGRSIADILEHVAWSKWMYEDYAFGSASLRGDQPPLVPASGARSRPRDQLLAWLTDGQRRWLASVRALPNDSELDRDRLTNWGERLPHSLSFSLTRSDQAQLNKAAPSSRQPFAFGQRTRLAYRRKKLSLLPPAAFPLAQTR